MPTYPSVKETNKLATLGLPSIYLRKSEYALLYLSETIDETQTKVDLGEFNGSTFSNKIQKSMILKS